MHSCYSEEYPNKYICFILKGIFLKIESNDSSLSTRYTADIATVHFFLHFSHASHGDKSSLLHSSKDCVPWGKRRPALSLSLLPLGWAQWAGLSPHQGQMWVCEVVNWGRAPGWCPGVGEPSSSGCWPHQVRGHQHPAAQGSMSLAHRMGWIWEKREKRD